MRADARRKGDPPHQRGVQANTPWSISTHNLPAQLSSLVGRERELAEVARLLETARLLTLTGAGGVGKTRLALAAASVAVQTYPDGVWLASLAALVDPTLVPQAVAAAIGVRERGGRPVVATLTEVLRERRALLVLDNCEHLIQACAELVETLLQGCSGVTILATSRERLGVAGEVMWRVPSLSVPKPPGPAAEQLSQYEAVRLFVERAEAVRPDFKVTDANAPAVADVCRRLDGIPLAIELAAVWLRTLSVEQLAARLDDRFHLLVGGSRTAPPRQQTLRGAIEWSYDLLSQPERQLFSALSVFAGGWTLEAAEAVCAREGVPTEATVRLLRQLVDKSLVVADQAPDGTRFRLLGSLHAYASERAQAAGDLPDLERRHLEWCLALAQSVPLPWPNAQETGRLVKELDNLRAALRYTVESGDATMGLRLAVTLWPLWYMRGLYTEGRAWFSELLALPGALAPTALRARAFAFAGYLTSLQGQVSEAVALLHEGLATAEHAAASNEQTLCSHFLGDLAFRRGALIEAAAQYERALTLARGTGRHLWEAWAVHDVAHVQYELGETAAARGALAELVELSEGTDDPRLVAHVLALRGRQAALDGDHDAAFEFEEQSLALMHTIGDQHGLAFGRLEAAASALLRGDRRNAARQLAGGLAVAHESGEQLVLARGLEGAAQLAATSEPNQAVRLVGAAAALRDRLGLERTARDRARLDAWLADACRSLGQAGYAKTWEQGQRDALEHAVTMALALTESVGADRPSQQDGDAAPLTAREREVALLLAGGLSNRQVADALAITEGTARIHTQRVLAKLGLRSRVQVTDWARAQGLLADSRA